MGGHVFLEYMSIRMTCITGIFVLWEDTSCKSACLQDSISFRTMCFTRMHVLQEDRSYLRVCLIRGHV